MFQFFPYKDNVFRDILFFIVFFCMVKFENLIEKKKILRKNLQNILFKTILFQYTNIYIF